MERRNFLYNSALLIPGVLLTSLSGWASPQRNQKEVIFITSDTSLLIEKVAAAVRSDKSSLEVVSGSNIKELKYTGEGFVITTRDGKQFLAAKVVSHSLFAIDPSQLVVEITTGNNSFPIDYNSGKNKKRLRPELWAYEAGKFGLEDIKPFLKRKKHALLCIS